MSRVALGGDRGKIGRIYKYTPAYAEKAAYIEKHTSERRNI